MPLSNETKKQYRLIGHNLRPIVTIAGKGLTEAVMAEINRALTDHELIKIKIAIMDREVRKQAVSEICTELKADVVQEIGKVALLFRAAAKPNPKTSNLC